MAGKRKPRGNQFSDVPHKKSDPDTSYQGPDREVVFGEAEPDPEPIPETKPEFKLEPPAKSEPAAALIPDPVLPKPRVELRVYLATSGHKMDQIAGFRHWASKQDLAKRTIPEWRELHQNFNARPTK